MTTSVADLPGAVRPGIPFRTKIFYGIGQVTESLKSTPFEVFLLFYYVQVLGVSGSLVGLAILLAMVVDAVTDPLVGSWSDSLRTRLGRRHPLMYASILPFSLSLYAVFAPPAGLDEAGLLLWLLCFAVAARVSITLFAVPYYALGAEMTRDYAERTTLVAYRSFFGTLGIGAVIYVAFGVFFAATQEFPNGQLNPAAYPLFALAIAISAVVIMLLSALGTQDQVPKIRKTDVQVPAIPFSPQRAFRELRQCAGNCSFRALFIGSIIFFVMRGVAQSLGLHMGTYFWELSPRELQLFNLSVIAGMIFALVFVRPLTGRFDKRAVLLSSVLLFVIATSLPPLLALGQLFPAPGSPNLLTWLVVFTGFSGVAGGLMYVASHSMMGDVADDHELSVRRRSEGILFGCLFLAMKAASGIGHWIAGVSLDLIRFPQGVEPAQIPPDAVWRLGALYGPLVALLGVLSVVAYRGYRINRETHKDTRRQLLAIARNEQ